jgi:2-oxoglutarate/2-oxoacid ferredoxin oxidoreductase subunit alpha
MDHETGTRPPGGAAAPPPAGGVRVNDFAIKIGTVNGTGSASANGLLMQAIFRMGIPVTGKNIFPSNIQGLPTWYEIRVSARGHAARTPRFDLLVAMNAATYQRDIAELQSGGYLLFDSSWPISPALLRPDVHFLGIPLAHMCRDAFQGGRERLLLKNIAYVGALAALLDVDLEVIHQLLREQYGAKQALIESNDHAVRMGYDYARAHFPCPLPFRLEAMAATDEWVLMDGNTALALGCVFAGATVGAWYPITPATSVMDAFRHYAARYRRDPATGRNRFIVMQAEDELAAAGMVIGAAWAGARSFTPTSGPGISLMGEFIGLAYYAEVPAVFLNVQRVGPSTGMPTRTQQGDLLLCAYASHGDTKHLLLFPADPTECFSMAVQAFDLAERFQTPVFVLSDLDIGMNDWRCRRLRWDDAYRPDRGKVLSAAELDCMKAFHRYLDVDGDGIAARTLPGTHPRGAYFTRGSGHDRLGGYTEDADAYQEVVDRIARKIESARTAVPPAAIAVRPGAAFGVVSIGSCDAAVREAIETFQEAGVAVDYMRIRGFPFGPEVEEFLRRHDEIYVVEMNRDAQLRTLLTLETAVEKARLRSVRFYGGVPVSAAAVVAAIVQERRGPGGAAGVAGLAGDGGATGVGGLATAGGGGAMGGAAMGDVVAGGSTVAAVGGAGDGTVGATVGGAGEATLGGAAVDGAGDGTDTVTEVLA